MSTGFECNFVEFQPGAWYYVLQRWDCPRGAWDWREYADCYGPFPSKEAADEHLRDHHANPGGSSTIRYSPDHATDEVLVRLVREARSADDW